MLQNIYSGWVWMKGLRCPSPTQALCVWWKLYSSCSRLNILRPQLSLPQLIHQVEVPCWQGEAKKTRKFQPSQYMLAAQECHSRRNGPLSPLRVLWSRAKILPRGIDRPWEEGAPLYCLRGLTLFEREWEKFHALRELLKRRRLW